MIKTVTFAAAAALTAAVATPALADDQRHEAQVAYADLDLTSDAGVDRLDSRIRSAVNRVCDAGASPDRIEMRWVRDCRRQTTEQVNFARDEAVRIARSGQRTAPELAVLQIAVPAQRQ